MLTGYGHCVGSFIAMVGYLLLVHPVAPTEEALLQAGFDFQRYVTESMMTLRHRLTAVLAGGPHGCEGVCPLAWLQGSFRDDVTG